MNSLEKLLTSVFVILFIVLLVASYFFSLASCNAKSVSFEDHDFGAVQGCMVKHKGKWLPLENIRGFD